MFSAIRIGLIISLIAAAGAGYLLVQKLQSDLQTARENVAKMEVAIQISLMQHYSETYKQQSSTEMNFVLL